MISLAEETLSNPSKCFIIAEAGVNHNGNIELAKKLIDVAVEAKADAIKFQTFKSENLVTPNTSLAEYQKENLGSEQNQLSMLKKLELNHKDFKELKEYCDKKGIMFLSTPHTEDAIDFLDKLVPIFKLGSGDLNNLPFLEKIAKKGKPIILGTGMGTLEEVKEARDTIKKYNKELILLHCTTNYPCPKEDVNLKAMLTLKKELGEIVGYSDHTSGNEVAIIAASLGASVIEKHFTLDKNMPGPDHKSSLNPLELKEMIRAIRNKTKIKIPESILGSGIKKPTSEELEIANLVRKSIVTNRDIFKNEKIKKEDLEIKRPGNGIAPKYLDKVVGRIVKRDLKKGELINLDDLKPKKVCIITGTRADYGYLRPVMQKIKQDKDFELIVIATGMHFFEKFGYTFEQVKKDFPEVIKAPLNLHSDDGLGIAQSVSEGISVFSKLFTEINPDFCLFLGDRTEIFAAVQAAAYQNIPIIHMHGGDVSSGMDEPIRHAITKFAHIHFPATPKSGERLLKMGENPNHIYVVGSSTLDELKSLHLPTKEELFAKYALDKNKPLLLVVQHPLSTQSADESAEQMKITLNSVLKTNHPSMIIYPNSDVGGQRMVNVIKEYEKKGMKARANLSREDYLGFLKHASILIGNSSSGIVESAFFKLPVINVGIRQKGRERDINVIDVEHNPEDIYNSIIHALTPEFKKQLINCKNIYGEGNTSEKICKIIKNIKVDFNLLQKRITY